MARGCGARVEGGLYACTDVSPFGKPIEFFLVDPAVRWIGPQLRSPMLAEDGEGVVHVLIGVGAEYYPTVPDFVEEARVMGVSKRLPRDFDPARLTPGVSKLCLIHPRAVPLFRYRREAVKAPFCPRRMKKMDPARHRCVGDLWPLSAMIHVEGRHEVTKLQGKALVRTPSAEYWVAPVPARDARMTRYVSGVFMAFPNWHFEYVSKKGCVPPEVRERVGARWRLEVVPE